MAVYDSIGRTYTSTRVADPRIARLVHNALGDATDVANIGAGAGSYEPATTVVAVEPSRVMIGQRPSGSAPALLAQAEHLPLADGSVDAALAMLTIHHWSDLAAGVAELRRVARRRLVFFTWLPEQIASFWLLADYLPEAAEIDARQAVPVERLVDLLGGAQVLPVPVPWDCTDGFGAAYWRRPEQYLRPEVQAGMSMLAKAGAPVIRDGLARLADDLRTGRWHEQHADLLQLESLDVGYCLVVADL